MPIIQPPTSLPAENGIKPATKKMVTTDNLSTISAAGYLNSKNLQGFEVSPSDVLQVLYSYDEQTDVGTFGLFSVSLSPSGVITLVPDLNEGNVVLPTVAGQLAEFADASGKIQDSNVIANRVLQCQFADPDLSANVVFATKAINASDLIGGGNSIIIPSSGTKRYTIVDFSISSDSTNFSGGGGDRNIVITDGGTEYSEITAATLANIPNARWGTYDGTGLPLPLPATAGMQLPTAAGASLVAEYKGGTTDYAVGTLFITYTAVRTL